ncbi:MAG: four helix bundle protein [bacterium]
MFDFEKLTVYQKAKEARSLTYHILSDKKGIDRSTIDQLKRYMLGIILNIAEGTGKSSKADKKNFFTIARGSTYETIAIIDILHDDKVIDQEDYTKLYTIYEEISKMLLGLINSLK